MARTWFPLYAADLLVDGKVALLTDAQFRMLVLVWCRLCIDGSVPSDPAGLGRVMGWHGNRARIAADFLGDFLKNHPTIPGHFYSERLEQETAKYSVIVERNRTNGKKGGRPRKPSGLVLGNPEITESQSQSQEDIDSKESTSPAPRKRAARKVVEETLEDILGGGKGTPTWEGYWRIASIFGHTKNPSPKASAKLYASALSSTDAETLERKARLLQGCTSEQKYMPQLAKWLDGAGYLNPDPQPHTPNGATLERPQPHHHRSASDSDYLRINGAPSSRLPEVQEAEQQGVDVALPF